MSADTALLDTQPDLPDLARRARWEVIKTVTSNKAGHIGGPLSMMDLLVSLYFRELRLRTDEPDWPDRDRFILSKGHAAIGLYAVLALRGFLDLDELPTFDRGDSRLQGHPDVTRLPGLDASTGSLGQGLSAGVGMAIGARLAEKDFHTFVLMGDGEIQEGMVVGGRPGRRTLQAHEPDRHRGSQRAATVRSAVGLRDEPDRPR